METFVALFRGHLRYRLVRAVLRTVMRVKVVALAVLLFATAAGVWPACDAGFNAARGGARGAPTPTALIVGPDDGAAPLLAAIRSARRRVLVEMYMLTAADAVQALVTARHAGCDVRVLLEATPYGAPDANLGAFAQLSAGGVAVHSISRGAGLVHIKIMIIDDTVFLLTMNLTVAGLSNNREYAIVDSDPREVAWTEAVWRADEAGVNLAETPPSSRILTSPLDARPRLAALIDTAETSILIEIEEISDSALVAGLLRARERGVAVTVVAPDENRSSATTATLDRLMDAGVSVRVLALPTVHAKAMVVDGRQLYVGSVNFTRASLDDNREMGILVVDPAVVARVAATVNTDALRGRVPPRSR